MDQNQTPLFDALDTYRSQSEYSFHVPGHKNGTSFPEKGSIFQPLLSIDATEVEGLDDLFHPRGAIARAQQLLTDLYQTEQSYFLVNGTTVGNLAMILATCKRGNSVFIQRNSHKSIFNGIKLSGAIPIILNSDLDDATQLPTGISEKTLDEAIERFPETRVLILTYPNYYGMAYDYKMVIQKAHEHGMIVLVDEAHGAHFKLGERVPVSTLQLGADIVVQSAHKSLPAMTMGSFIHINSKKVPLERMEHYLSMLQTSSPSYPIMASLDLARRALGIMTKDKLRQRLEEIEAFKNELKSILQIKVIDTSKDLNLKFDPFKILIQTNCELTGIQIQELLQKAGIYIELADEYHLLLMLSIYPGKNLTYAAQIIKETLSYFKVLEKKLPNANYEKTAYSLLELNYDEQQSFKTRQVYIENSVDCISAEDVIPYPPGVPLLLSGERITREHIQHIYHLSTKGVRFQGIDTSREIQLKIFQKRS